MAREQHHNCAHITLVLTIAFVLDVVLGKHSFHGKASLSHKSAHGLFDDAPLEEVIYKSDTLVENDVPAAENAEETVLLGNGAAFKDDYLLYPGEKGVTHVTSQQDDGRFTSRPTGREVVEYKCFCQIFTTDGVLVRDYGVLESNPHWPSSDCHYLHKRCRVKCSGRLDLNSYTSVQSEKLLLGLDYCQRYDKVTPQPGVVLQARWHALGCSHHPWHSSRKHVTLCCGYTTIPATSGSSMLMFGWNPDCKAKTFHISS